MKRIWCRVRRGLAYLWHEFQYPNLDRDGRRVIGVGLLLSGLMRLTVRNPLVHLRYYSDAVYGTAATLLGVALFVTSFRCWHRYFGGRLVALLGAHCYFATAAECQAHVQWFIDRAAEWRISDGVWVTEFAVLPCAQTTTGVKGQPDTASALREAQALVRWFERTRNVARYAWYVGYQPADAWYAFQPMPACDTSLFTATGQLTVFGTWYARRK